MSDCESGTCDICNKESILDRKYYYYDIKCDCCNNKDSDHFEIVKYCSECIPRPPKKISVFMQISDKG